MSGHYYGYGSSERLRHSQQVRVLRAFNLLVERLQEYSQKRERDIEDLDDRELTESARKSLNLAGLNPGAENPQAALEEFRTRNIRLSGIRQRRNDEILALKSIFSTTEPAKVSDEILKKTDRIFRDLVSVLALETSTPLKKPQEIERHIADIKIYSAAVYAIADPGGMHIDFVYPFDEDLYQT